MTKGMAALVAMFALSACVGETPTERAVVFGVDLLKTPAERCAEAQEIAAELDTPEAYALAAVACAG